MTTVTCEHLYSYGGMRFYDGVNPIPGSGARRRYYSHVYFCIKCTDVKGDPVVNERFRTSTYDTIKYNATPGTPAQCGVPLEDQ